MNTEEVHVTYEQAVRLKELGFDWPCNHYFFREYATLRWGNPADNFNDVKYFTSAPTLDQAHAWLRSKDYYIAIEWYTEELWRYRIYRKARPAFFNNHMEPSYEGILSSAITEALNLIKTENNKGK